MILELGIYTVRVSLRHDNPHWPRYLIYLGEKMIGRQFSVPTLSDCQWLHRTSGVFATSSTWRATSYGRTLPKRGRPRKEEAERRLQEALAA